MKAGQENVVKHGHIISMPPRLAVKERKLKKADSVPRRKLKQL